MAVGVLKRCSGCKYFWRRLCVPRINFWMSLFSQVFWRLCLHNSWASSSQTIPLERGTASKEQEISSLPRVTWPYSLTSAQQLVPSSWSTFLEKSDSKRPRMKMRSGNWGTVAQRRMGFSWSLARLHGGGLSFGTVNPITFGLKITTVH